MGCLKNPRKARACESSMGRCLMTHLLEVWKVSGSGEWEFCLRFRVQYFDMAHALGKVVL